MKYVFCRNMLKILEAYLSLQKIFQNWAITCRLGQVLLVSLRQNSGEKKRIPSLTTFYPL